MCRQENFPKSNKRGGSKGQIKSKSRLARRRFSQKTNGRICFVCFFTLHRKQIKFVRSFFWRIYGAPICFSILSDLQRQYDSERQRSTRLFTFIYGKMTSIPEGLGKRRILYTVHAFLKSCLDFSLRKKIRRLDFLLNI